MIVLKDPEAARQLGIVSTKAQIVAGEANWATFFGVLAQAAAIGGFIIISFVGSWVFGREYADHTVKDLLALPTPRATIVSAKFVVIVIWAALLFLVMTLLGLVVGYLVLGPFAAADLSQGLTLIAIPAVLTILLVTPVAFFGVAGQVFAADGLCNCGGGCRPDRGRGRLGRIFSLVHSGVAVWCGRIGRCATGNGELCHRDSDRSGRVGGDLCLVYAGRSNPVN
ncbi:MAG: ABC transporter permease [Chloroflexota bacterium]